MADIRGMDSNMENNMGSNAGVLLYNPWSDFINLTKLKQVKIARKLKARKRRESEETGRTSALKRWIWENVEGVMDIKMSRVVEKMKVVQTSNGDMRVSIKRRKYTMGLVTEEMSMTCSLFRFMKTLSEEEWGRYVWPLRKYPELKPSYGCQTKIQDQSDWCRERNIISLQHQSHPREISQRKMFQKVSSLVGKVS